ncbi:MAG: ATP-binding cassette domain-containing protein [Treponema sp.]|nr:ATP-binding cassette domain-containing protein [Treponema sp.]
MIELKGISKTFKVYSRKKGAAAAFRSLFKREYREIRALNGISFTVEKGEIAGFIGPNGAGKSTAIKIMSGILVPDSGDCQILGMCPWKSRKHYVGSIGVVFGQRTQLWWDVPVQDSLELLQKIYAVDETLFRKNLHYLIDVLELRDLLSTPLRQLSLGQRMKCEIAASLLHGPQVLFLDEPTIGLDAPSKLAMRQIIGELNRELKITVILTSHDMDDIEALTNRILLIGKGKLLYDGPLAKLRSQFDQIRRLELFYEGQGPSELPAGVRIISERPNHGIYEVDTNVIGVSQALQVLGKDLDIRDMSAASRPIEELISSLYREGNL